MREDQLDTSILSWQPKEFMRSDSSVADTLRCELAAEVLQVFGSLYLRVTGSSMLPSIWPGDTLLIQQLGIKRIVAGDIVLFEREGRLFAHRVISVTGTPEQPLLMTQGDALRTPDGLVSETELLGKVSRILRGQKRIEPLRRPGLCSRLSVDLIRHSAWAARLLLRLYSIRTHFWKREEPCSS